MPASILSRVWPEWTLEKRLGSGSYGAVYEAVRNDYGVENRGAIKVISIPASEAEVDSLRADGLSDQAIRNHFLGIVNDFVNEIRVMVSLEGRPNIVHVKDYKVSEKEDRFGWDILILMELLTPFAEYISNKTMTEQEVIKLGCDICSALETCQHEKIIHRDVKPGNIMVHSKSGEFKLGDFGIARKFEGLSTGLSQRYTPKYMAPEVATTTFYDARVDLYSLGVVLYQLLNKMRIPFQESQQVNSMQELDNAIKRRNRGEPLPKPVDASDAMAKVILKACAFRPEDRFATAAEMHKALLRLGAGVPAPEATRKAVPVNASADHLERTVAVRKASEPKAEKRTAAPKPEKKPQASAAVVSKPKPEKKPKAPVVVVFNAKEEKRRRRKIAVTTVMLSFLAMVITLTVLFFTSTAFSVMLSMNRYDHQKAWRDYRKDVKGHAVQELLVKTLLKGSVNKTVDAYYDGDLSFGQSVDRLDILDHMNVSGAGDQCQTLAQECMDTLLPDVRAGKITVEAAQEELNLLKEMGYENLDSIENALNDAYVDSVFDQYESGQMDFDTAEGKLQELIHQGHVEVNERHKELMNLHAHNVVSQYASGELDYGTASVELKELSAKGCTDAASCINELEELRRNP